MIVVLMGVSGAGKSAVGAALAGRVGAEFLDADDFHLQENVTKMESGTALTDDDRWPWLDRIGACLCDAEASPRGVAIACSALKRAYRDRIRAAAPGVRFVFLDGPAALIETRMAARTGHYMPGTLLASQLQTLERPGADEGDVERFSIELRAEEIITRATAALVRGCE